MPACPVCAKSFGSHHGVFVHWLRTHRHTDGNEHQFTTLCDLVRGERLDGGSDLLENRRACLPTKSSGGS